MDYQVPIFTCTREDIVNTSWDLTIEQVQRIEQFLLETNIHNAEVMHLLSCVFVCVSQALLNFSIASDRKLGKGLGMRLHVL